MDTLVGSSMTISLSESSTLSSYAPQLLPFRFSDLDSQFRRQGSVGTCGPPQIALIPGSTKFNGEIHHSSRLDNVDLKNKKLIIIGSGASAVEAAELGVANGAKEIVVLARDDKWIIPRNTAFDIALALKPYGAQTRLSWIPEKWVSYSSAGSETHGGL